MTPELNLKDRKILYQLDLDSRQTNTKIAKKVGLSKDAVGYRIKQYEKEGIIRGYTTVIDSAKLGYILYRVYFNLIDVSPEKLDELTEFLKNEKNVWWIAKLDGCWNFLFAIWVSSNVEFREFYNRFNLKFRKYIKDKLICPLTTYKQFNKTYLLETQKDSKIESIGGGEKSEYDKKDLEILKILSKNARIQLINLSKRVKLDSMAIYRRIKKLEERKIIQGYKANFDFSLLKRDLYSIKINLYNTSNINELENYVKSIPETIAISETIGGYDFEFDLEVGDSEEYFKIIEKLEKEFDTIREINYFRVIKNYKIIYMPEID